MTLHKIDAHICTNGGWIRKWCYFLCSLCPPNKPGIDVQMTEEEIDDYNAELRAKRKVEEMLNLPQEDV